MDKHTQRIENKMNTAIDQYLAQVAEQNPFAMPQALFQAFMFRLTFSAFSTVVNDLDDCLKQLEDEFKKTIDDVKNDNRKEKNNG